MIDKIIELESDPSQTNSSTGAQSSNMFLTGAYFSCAPAGGWQPAIKVGGVRKTVAAARKKGTVRKTAKGAAKSVKWQSTTPRLPKALATSITQSSTGKRSRKRASTPDSSQVPNAKKPRKATTTSSTRNNPKPLGKGKSVATKATHVTKVAAKTFAGPKKSKSTARPRQPKGNTRVKMQKMKSVSTKSSRKSK